MKTKYRTTKPEHVITIVASQADVDTINAFLKRTYFANENEPMISAVGLLGNPFAMLATENQIG